MSVPERQTFQNKIKELENQLKEAKKAAKESPRHKPLTKKPGRETEEMRDMKSRLQHAAEESASFRSKIKELETQLRLEEVEKKSLMTKFRDLEAQVEAEKSSAAGSGAAGGAAAEGKPSSKQRQKHKKELAAMQRKYDDELKELRKQLQETKVQYSSEVELLQNERVADAKKIKELERQVKEISLSGQSSESDAETSGKDSKELLKKLKAELKRVTADRDRLLHSSDHSEMFEFELHELKMRVDMLETEKIKMSSTIEQLTKENEELLSEKEKLAQKLNEKDADIVVEEIKLKSEELQSDPPVFEPVFLSLKEFLHFLWLTVQW